MQTTIDYDFNGITLKVEADVSPYVAAKIYGPAEDCHPEEGGDIENMVVKLMGNEIIPDEDLKEKIEDAIWEEINQPEEERY